MAPDVADLIDLTDERRVATIVNLDGRRGDEFAANVARYDSARPGRVATYCHLD